MSQVTLLIEPKDLIALNTFDGNIDIDNINPIIFIAQTTHLKSFLGLPLYTKIYTDFVDDTLAGEYLIIFDEYIKDLLSYYTASLFVSFGGYKVTENGLHRMNPENTTALDFAETEHLSKKYIDLVSNVEANFKVYVSDKNITELADKTITVENSFPWQ